MVPSTFAQNALHIYASNSPYFFIDGYEVPQGDSLILHPGAEVIVGTFQDITVHGSFRSYGDSENPAVIRAANPSLGWGVLDVKNTSDSLILEHTEIQEGRLYVNGCPARLFETHLVNNQTLQWDDIVIRVWFSEFEMSYSSITGSNQGEGVICHDCPAPLISHCEFDRMPDAVELINCVGGRISNCTFHDMNDDAIDLNNCSDVLIDSNVIYNVEHRGLELGSEQFGSSTEIKISFNTIFDCTEAINFKEGSTGLIENNTFHSNEYAIATLTLPGFDQEIVEVKNCIFSENDVDIFRDHNSIVEVTYSCFTQFAESGTGNFKADPMFLAPESNDFHIDNDSPCVNSGTSSTAGKRWDIGAHQNEPDRTEYIQGVKVWPNPSNRVFHIRFLDPFQRFIVFDLLGNEIFREDISNQSYLLKQFPSLLAGQYILRFESEDSSVSLPIVVL